MKRVGLTRVDTKMTSYFIVGDNEASTIVKSINECPVAMYIAGTSDANPIPLSRSICISEYARYFDIQEVFEVSDNIDPKCISFLAEEAAFCEEYCDYIMNLCEKLSQDPQYVDIAKRISDTILGEAITIIKNHMEQVEKAYYSFHNKNKSDTIEVESSFPIGETDKNFRTVKEEAFGNSEEG